MATKTFKIGLSATDKQNMAQDVYERLLDLTFAEYDSSETYNTGDFVVYNDSLYQCKEDNVTGTWDNSKWKSATLQDLLDDVESAVASVSGKANTIDLLNGTLVPAKSLVSEQIENISEDSGTKQDNPFTFQATATNGGAGASDTAPTAKYLKLKGKTYCFNQLARLIDYTETTNGVTITKVSSTGKCTISGTAEAQTQFTLIGSQQIVPTNQSHKYLVKLNLKGTKPNNSTEARNNLMGINFGWDDNIVFGGSNNSTYSQITILSGATVDFEIEPQIIDLTQLFNGDIPEEITNGVSLPDYNLTFTGIDIFNQLFPLHYYSYNAGTLVSANATKLTTLGKNQFDGVFVIGGLDDDTGEETTNDRFKRSGFIKVIPSQTYMLLQSGGINSKTSAQRRIYEYDGNKNYIKKTIYFNNASQFNSPITHSLTSNTQYVRICYYEPNKELDISNACFFIAWLEDGTTSRPDFEEYVKHEYALGSELEEHPLLSCGSGNNFVCDEKLPDGTITRKVGSRAYQSGDESDSTLITDGTTTYYPLSSGNIYAEQGDSFPAVIEVDDFGTMEYGGTNYNGYPQGCEFFYPADYALFIDTLGNGVDWEAGDIAKNSELNSKFETYLKSLTGYDNAKTQTLKNVSGTLTWVDD